MGHKIYLGADHMVKKRSCCSILVICDVDHCKIKVLIRDGIYWTDYMNDHEVMIMARSHGGGNFMGIPPSVTVRLFAEAGLRNLRQIESSSPYTARLDITR